MKKFLVFVLVIALIGLLSGNNLFAQTVNYDWSGYGVSFSIPKTHEVKKSAADEFESGNDLTWLQMYPFNHAFGCFAGIFEGVHLQPG